MSTRFECSLSEPRKTPNKDNHACHEKEESLRYTFIMHNFPKWMYKCIVILSVNPVPVDGCRIAMHSGDSHVMPRIV